MNIEKVAVIGAGTMGAQIAQTMTQAGIGVRLIDLDEGLVRRGMETIRNIYQTGLDKGKISSQEMKRKIGLASGGSDYESLGDVDLAIEAVFEDIAVKRKVFEALDSACPPRAILASNSSSLSISALARMTGRPDRVIGMHFFNPVYAMKLVEVIPGLPTAPETVSEVMKLSKRLKKVAIKVQECPGFVVNRLLMPYLNEAALALQEGSAAAPAIDDAMKAFGMPMGPFVLLDVIGIDIAEKVCDVLYEGYGPRMSTALLLKRLVGAGRFGKKSGAGIYRYDGKTDEALSKIMKQIQDEAGEIETPFTPQRLLLLMINEAALSLQEGTASAEDIDLAMVLGTGFPKDKGGPLHYADQVGLDMVLDELRRASNTVGPRFWPAPILTRMVAAGYTGVKSGRGFFAY